MYTPSDLPNIVSYKHRIIVKRIIKYLKSVYMQHNQVSINRIVYYSSSIHKLLCWLLNPNNLHRDKLYCNFRLWNHRRMVLLLRIYKSLGWLRLFQSIQTINTMYQDLLPSYYKCWLQNSINKFDNWFEGSSKQTYLILKCKIKWIMMHFTLKHIDSWQINLNIYLIYTCFWCYHTWVIILTILSTLRWSIKQTLTSRSHVLTPKLWSGTRILVLINLASAHLCALWYREIRRSRVETLLPSWIYLRTNTLWNLCAL